MFSGSEAKTTFCCSWSGGKDSCLAFYRAMRSGLKPAALLTMLVEGGKRTRSHGLPRSVIEAQAAALGVQLLTIASTWEQYERHFISILNQAATAGIGCAVFGDIDIERHRDWEEMVCRAANVRAYLPLWQEPRQQLLAEWWSHGFKALIVVVRDPVGREFLGEKLDATTVQELMRRGADPCGENGEFHTVVTDGPIFSRPLRVRMGKQTEIEDCWVQDVILDL